MEGWVNPGPRCKEQLAHDCYATACGQRERNPDLAITLTTRLSHHPDDLFRKAISFNCDVLNHVSSHFFIQLSDSSLCGTVFHHTSLLPPSLFIFCCRLKSHLFSLSYPAFWLFSHLYSAHTKAKEVGGEGQGNTQKHLWSHPCVWRPESTHFIQFLQHLSIACYAEMQSAELVMINHSIWLYVWPSVTRWHCVNSKRASCLNIQESLANAREAHDSLGI